MAKMLGAEMFLETLKHEGIDVVFGLPVGYVLRVYDAMTKYLDDITHVLASHEQGATRIANGYDGFRELQIKTRGIVLCTSGPALCE